MPSPQSHHPERHILLIDRRAYRLEENQRAIRERGFQVITSSGYTLPDASVQSAALAILVCTTVGAEELALVHRLGRFSQHPLVLATQIDSDAMRQLFLAGASDTAALPSTPRGFARAAEKALETAEAPRSRLLLAGAR